MFDSLRAKKPLYPLVGLISSVATLIAGMLFSKHLSVFLFIAILAVLYAAFGFGKVELKVGAMMLCLGLLIGLLSAATSRSFDSFWQTVGRTLLLGICSVPIISIPPADLTRCLVQLKCPRVITLGMLVTIRFIPVLVGEIRQIWEAMKTRGARMAWYRFDCLYRAFFIPLTMRIINISDTLSLSLETRGFVLDDKEATVYHPIAFHLRDGLFSLLVTCSIVGLVVIA